MTMTSSRPYLLRAIYQWIVDNGCTPYLLVDATRKGVIVPTQHVKDGQIILNISPSAVVGLVMDDHFVMFSARFGGVPMEVSAPMAALMGIYARENGQGMLFEPEDFPEPPHDGESPTTEPAAKKAAPGTKPALRVIK